MSKKQKHWWNTLLEYSVAVAAISVMAVCAVGLMAVVGIAVLISKLSVIIE